ncbi:hypothetical protein GCM10020220_077410 [Nonomuraea rubra]|uniref:hypothetical protein n=1 Tax=Nonomuraea rubra TaxID=46180 RepID=UPI00338559C5
MRWFAALRLAVPLVLVAPVVRRQMLCDILLDEAELAPDWWDGHLIPSAAANDGGNLFIDTRTGRTGEYYNENGLSHRPEVVWPSYLALLEDTARALETGEPIRGWRPALKRGRLDWLRARRPRRARRRGRGARTGCSARPWCGWRRWPRP